MKTFILRGAPINRLLDSELKTLQEAGVEFAMTANNDMFGIDNKTDLYPFNTNTLVFMWPEYYVENKHNWIDKINNTANAVAEIVKNIFDYRKDDIWVYREFEWDNLKNELNNMNANQTIVYDLNCFGFCQ